MLQQIINPTNVPEGVTTGYQRQNNNLYILNTGLDTIKPRDNGNGVITIPMGGIIEINGVMFKVNENVTLNKPNINTAYWIEIIDNGDSTAVFNLVTRPGEWNYSKQGCYTLNNRRTLNYISLGTLSAIPTTGAEYISPTVKGEYHIQLSVGWKYVTMSSGAGSGNGGNGSNGGINYIGTGGGGGVASTVKTLSRILFIYNHTNILKIGGNGSNGSSGANGNYGTYGSNNDSEGGNGGSGGGSGGGEETTFNNLTTGFVIPGKGGNSRYGGIGGRYQNGSRGYTQLGGLSADGGNSGLGNLCGGGGGGGSGGEFYILGTSTPGAGGTGGNGGNGGDYVSNGSPGGYCNIYSLTN